MFSHPQVKRKNTVYRAQINRRRGRPRINKHSHLAAASWPHNREECTNPERAWAGIAPLAGAPAADARTTCCAGRTKQFQSRKRTDSVHIRHSGLRRGFGATHQKARPKHSSSGKARPIGDWSESGRRRILGRQKSGRAEQWSRLHCAPLIRKMEPH